MDHRDHSHDHQHGHSHDHSHDHGHSHELSFEQKLEKLLGHWIDHNDSHKETFQTWADRSKDAGLDGISDCLAEVGTLSQKVTDLLKKAQGQLNG